MQSRIVNFYSDGFRLEADYYTPSPDKTAQRAAIVLCHGFGGKRDDMLPIYAQKFAQAGYAVLAFDYRGFGTSEGERGRIIPQEHVEDIRCALTWLETQNDVDSDRLGVWGTSNGGAHIVYVAGIDTRVKCAVGQVGFADGRTLVLGHKTPEQRDALLAEFHQDRIQRIKSGKSNAVDVLELVGSTQSRQFMAAGLDSTPTVSLITIQSGEATLDYRPVDVAADIAPRALMLIAAENDDLCPIDEYKQVYDRAGEPKRWVSYPIGHYEIYQSQWFEQSTAEAISWFNQHL